MLRRGTSATRSLASGVRVRRHDAVTEDRRRARSSTASYNAASGGSGRDAARSVAGVGEVMAAFRRCSARRVADAVQDAAIGAEQPGPVARLRRGQLGRAVGGRRSAAMTSFDARWWCGGAGRRGRRSRRHRRRGRGRTRRTGRSPPPAPAHGRRVPRRSGSGPATQRERRRQSRRAAMSAVGAWRGPVAPAVGRSRAGPDPHAAAVTDSSARPARRGRIPAGRRACAGFRSRRGALGTATSCHCPSAMAGSTPVVCGSPEFSWRIVVGRCHGHSVARSHVITQDGSSS